MEMLSLMAKEVAKKEHLNSNKANKGSKETSRKSKEAERKQGR